MSIVNDSLVRDLIERASEGSLSEVRRLIAVGVDPSVRSNVTFETALHAAALGAHVDVVEELLRSGCPPDILDSGRQTALALTVHEIADPLGRRAELLRVLKCLLEFGASPVSDSAEMSPLALSESYGLCEVTELLHEALRGKPSST